MSYWMKKTHNKTEGIQISSKTFEFTPLGQVQQSSAKEVVLCAWATNQECSQIMVSNFKYNTTVFKRLVYWGPWKGGQNCKKYFHLNKP